MSPERARAASQAYLAKYDLSFESLNDAVGDLGAQAGMYLTGSVIIGRGTSYSDIDLMVVGPTDWRSPPGSLTLVQSLTDVNFRTPNGREINIGLWPANGFSDLPAKMARCHELLQQPDAAQSVPMLTDLEFIFLHELRAGVPVVNSAIIDGQRQKLRTDDLPLHGIVRYLAGHFARREDAIAQVQEGDDHTAKWMLRTSMTDLAKAALCSVGQTDHRVNWMFVHLRDNEDSLGAEVVARYAKLICEWDGRSAREVVTEAITFSDQQVATIVARAPALLPILVGMGQRAGVVQQMPA